MLVLALLPLICGLVLKHCQVRSFVFCCHFVDSMLHFSISLFGFSPFSLLFNFFILCGRHLQAKTLDSLLCFAGLASSRVVTSFVVTTSVMR